LALTIFSALALAQDLTPEIRADVDRRTGLQRSWDGRANSPGAELRAVEVMRAPAGKGIYVFKYELHAKGLPTDLGYELLMLPTMAGSVNELQSTGDVTIDKQDGRVLNGPGEPYGLILPDPASGEPYRFAVASKDGKYKAFAAVVPNPIEARDGGCKVSVIRLMSRFELAFVQAAGFPPQTEIAVHANSEGEIHDSKMTTNADGYGDVPVLPFKLGKKKGKIEMQLTTPKCAPKVSFKWGATEDGQPYQ
jgi:hypothetical protein